LDFHNSIYLNNILFHDNKEIPQPHTPRTLLIFLSDIMAATLHLSSNDARILNKVFDPESAPEAPKIAIDPILPADARIRNLSLLTALRAQEMSAIRLVEALTTSSDSPSLLSRKHAVYTKALHILSGLIADHPNYASAYNNRAQLHRWRYGDRGVLVQPMGAENANVDEARIAIENALHDLDSAISLASPVKGSNTVSPAQGKLLAQAWTQRAAIFWGAAKDLGRGGQVNIGEEDMEWREWDKTRFEEEGSRCFYMAGIFGSEVGKAMAVVANPHARLCGNIVKEALRRERCGA
jgi:hypothetical protein